MKGLRTNSFILFILGISILVRLYGLALYPYIGDEYFTLSEAKQFGLNWNSAIYFRLMNLWIQFGVNEFQLWLVSVIFGILTVVLFYELGKALENQQVGLLAALLAALSPFNIYHSQELRFYSFFIFSSLLFIITTVRFVRSRRAVFDYLLVAVSGIILIFSHFLGAIFVLVQCLATFTALNSRLPRWATWLVSGTFLTACFMIPTIPAVYQTMWSFYRIYGNAAASVAPLLTPFSFINFAKVLVAVYIFFFGYHVYPLWFLVVVPGSTLMVALLFTGCKYLVKRSQWGALPFLTGIGLAGVYFTLDMVGGRVAGGVSLNMCLNANCQDKPDWRR